MKKKLNLKEKRRQKKDRPQMAYIPPVLMSRYKRFLSFAGLVFIAGLIATFMGIGIWYLTFIMFTLVAAALLVTAILFKRNIKYNGFFMMEGKIIYIGTSGTNVTKKPAYYHIKNDEGNIFQIPVHKKSLIVPLNSTIRIFAPVDVFVFENEGIFRLATLWCYELVSAPDATSKDDEE